MTSWRRIALRLPDLPDHALPRSVARARARFADLTARLPRPEPADLAP